MIVLVKPNCFITFPYCYRDAPLYLEWAPGNILEPKTLPDNSEKKSDVGGNDVRRVNLEQRVEIDPDVTEVCPAMIVVNIMKSYFLPFCVVSLSELKDSLENLD